jgi:hypothetical protein
VLQQCLSSNVIGTKEVLKHQTQIIHAQEPMLLNIWIQLELYTGNLIALALKHTDKGEDDVLLSGSVVVCIMRNSRSEVLKP